MMAVKFAFDLFGLSFNSLIMKWGFLFILRWRGLHAMVEKGDLLYLYGLSDLYMFSFFLFHIPLGENLFFRGYFYNM